jgi:hypothetical protein
MKTYLVSHAIQAAVGAGNKLDFALTSLTMLALGSRSGCARSVVVGVTAAAARGGELMQCGITKMMKTAELRRWCVFIIVKWMGMT